MPFGPLSQQEAYRALESRMVTHTVNSLFRLMRDRFHEFPDNYLAVDTETTGVNFQNDLIWQIGHCLVKKGQIADRGGVILDWTRHPQVDQRWLKDRLIETKRHVETDSRTGLPTGKTYHINYERMADEGVEPEPIIQQYLEWFKDVRAEKMFFLAHNGYAFDVNMLESHFRRWCSDNWSFDDWELFDSGMVLKASQASMAPWNGDSPRAFCRRVNSQWLKGIKWSLDQYAVPRFKLTEKYQLDMAAAHDASFDAYVTHLLFQEFCAAVRPVENLCPSPT